MADEEGEVAARFSSVRSQYTYRCTAGVGSSSRSSLNNNDNDEI